MEWNHWSGGVRREKPLSKRKVEEGKDSKIIEKLKLEIVGSNLEGGNDNAKFVKWNLQHARKQQHEIEYTITYWEMYLQAIPNCK